MPNRLCHDVAWAATLQVLEVFNLRDEEKHEAFGRIYEQICASLAAYDLQQDRLNQKLRPSSN